MTRSELQAIANGDLYTLDQKAKAIAALDAQKPSMDDYAMLVPLRRQVHDQMVADGDTRRLAEWSHNWPDYATTGKVLGE